MTHTRGSHWAATTNPSIGDDHNVRESSETFGPCSPVMAHPCCDGGVRAGVPGGGHHCFRDSHNDGNGANQSGPFDPNGVGEGDNQGNGNAPANGTVGKADGKNPPGQVKNGGDRGYECDDNSGVGNNGGNPAHSGCASSTGTSPPVLPTESTAPTVAPTESSVPGTRATPVVLPRCSASRGTRRRPCPPQSRGVPATTAAPAAPCGSSSAAGWFSLVWPWGSSPAASRGKHTL